MHYIFQLQIICSRLTKAYKVNRTAINYVWSRHNPVLEGRVQLFHKSEFLNGLKSQAIRISEGLLYQMGLQLVLCSEVFRGSTIGGSTAVPQCKLVELKLEVPCCVHVE